MFSISQKWFFSIGVVFLKGVAGQETIFKLDRSDLSDTEKEILLNADSAGHTWDKSTTPGADEAWIRDDGAIAVYATLKQTMNFESKEYSDAQHAKKQVDEKSTLKDF